MSARVPGFGPGGLLCFWALEQLRQIDCVLKRFVAALVSPCVCISVVKHDHDPGMQYRPVTSQSTPQTYHELEARPDGSKTKAVPV